MTVAPSLLSANFTRFDREMTRFLRTGAEILHLDVMDGNFVPNITFGYSLIGALRPLAPGIIFDVHLMMTHPLAYIERFAKAGADIITVHVECDDDVSACIDAIHAQGIKAGISVKPDTPAEAIYEYLDRLQLALVMTVHPGFGGQTMIYRCLDKIPEIRQKAQSLGNDSLLISVDGGINNDTCTEVAAKGANILVAGNAVFGTRNMPAAFDGLMKRVAPGYKRKDS
ncbi:MAG: ribulose-phosphate 3-epimerase [Clostridia bacterium]|nr:ribulose-phosphate 3-epimerase [Clostridia bacterium]MBQ9994315.1 ribulose-phosphate 3-epimerase [Clostridia bacterium]